MEQIENDAFDAWYRELCALLAQSEKCAPYKMAWMEFYERGVSITEAANIGPYELL